MTDPHCRHKVGAVRGQSAHRTSIDFNKQIGTANPVVNAQLSKEQRRLYNKEIELMNSIGPMSLPERHYPKSFKILPKKPEGEDET